MSSETNEMFFDVQQKTDKQHILDNPDTYVGSVELVDTDCWILSDDGSKIVNKNIAYIPGLFKLFDEGIVNCRDHVVRMATKVEQGAENSLPVTFIDVSIQDDGSIIMINDGNGIDVVQHPEYKTWVPELIFGHLRTSTNYNKEEKKIVGGKNGFGFKLVLIWSTYGYIETVDHIRGLKYTQEFRNNLNNICEPRITKVSGKTVKPYTKVVFKPDYARFGLTNGLTADMIHLLKKRVYDISAVTDKAIKVKYNSQLIPTKNFEQYINLYIGTKEDAPRVYESAGIRWEYAVAMSPTREFIQVSFVNGIYTSKGGKHVEYILNQIIKKLTDAIEKKKKVKVNFTSIKEQLMLFIRCDIENPAFDSQTKDFMNTPFTKFGSKCEVSDKFIEKVAKLGVMDAALQITELKENKVAKKSDGTKSKSIRGIPKLDDANWAGTDKSHLCTIIFCEGDSAKTGVISGLKSEDRNTIGVYPLKGKVMNVRGENVKKVSENKEITEIKKILGLEMGREYKSIEEVNKSLRYSKVVFMTDQDLDGSHIKGLCINLFQNEWGSLTRLPGFIGFMNTPILKARNGTQELKFYNEGEYEKWKSETPVSKLKSWNIKYYKGLGTSSKIEFREYFEEKRFVGFEHTGAKSDDAIDMVFNKKRADDRKHWLETVYNRDSYADTSKAMIPYEEFIDTELIKFSKYDCDRSIPNLMDGLKISLRKILYGAFKKRLSTEIKVSQFSGYVSENSCYHHGEESLNKAIVGMAQNFVGSNNINLLFPSGQFGSRIKGGQDASSTRYISTRLERITRCLFPDADDAVLDYLNDDGTLVEPQFYVPILPMVLVNGSKGIGTGFSTDIMCYNPLDIVTYLRDKLSCSSSSSSSSSSSFTSTIDFIPYYNGFTGEVRKLTETKYLFKGKYERVEGKTDTIRVTELPVGFWTEDFKELLNELCDDKDKDGKKITPIVKDILENYTDTTVDFVVTFSKDKLTELEAITADHGCNGVEKVLKLFTTNSTTNMNLFNAQDRLTKYNSVSAIIDDYYGVRLDFYRKRKEYIIAHLEKALLILSNKVKYIQETLDGTIDLRKKKRTEIVSLLESKGFCVIDDDSEYKYLIKMAMDSVSEENVEKMMNEHQTKTIELERIRSTTVEQMWRQELETFSEEYISFLDQRVKSQMADTKANVKSVVKKIVKLKKQEANTNV